MTKIKKKINITIDQSQVVGTYQFLTLIRELHLKKKDTFVTQHLIPFNLKREKVVLEMVKSILLKHRQIILTTAFTSSTVSLTCNTNNACLSLVCLLLETQQCLSLVIPYVDTLLCNGCTTNQRQQINRLAFFGICKGVVMWLKAKIPYPTPPPHFFSMIIMPNKLILM